MFPSKNDISILFAHVAYQLAQRFELRSTGIKHTQAWTREELDSKIADAEKGRGLSRSEEAASPVEPKGMPTQWLAIKLPWL